MSAPADTKITSQYNTEDMIIPKFTQKEYENYSRQNDKAHFSSPEDEYRDGFGKYKVCSMCNENKRLTDFNGNTSGTDAFDKKGYRLKRPECSICTRRVSIGKAQATKIATKEGIPYKAPDGTNCAICNKIQTEKNKLVFDHCHKTEKFRGYCCNSCNRSLGVLGDNVEGLVNAINYLLKSEPVKIIQNVNGNIEIIK
jgi:hypothetical protein